MSQTQQSHQQLKDLLARQDWDAAQALWLDLAEQLSDQPEFLLLLIQDFTNAGQLPMAAELAALIADALKSAGKHHEWLFALKLQAEARPMDKNLRTELVQAYQSIHQSDVRLKSVLAASEIDRTTIALPAALAKVDTLLALRVGAYCQHKSWGFGRVKSFDTSVGRVVVAFAHNPDHSMQLAYAAESLVPVNDDHIDVRKLTDLAALQQLAAADPLALVRIVLLSYNRRATSERIESALAGSVVPSDQWKKWWEGAKKLLKRDPHFDVPGKKTDPYILRAAPVSQQDELLEAFRAAPSLPQKSDVVRQFLKIVDNIEKPDLLTQEFQDGLLAGIERGPGKIADRIEAAFALEDLARHSHAPSESVAPLVERLLNETQNLAALLDQVSVAGQKRVLAALKASQPDRLRADLNRLPARALDEIADLLAPLAPQVEQLMRNQTASLDLLYWLCKTVIASSPPAWVESLPHPALLNAVFQTIEDTDRRSPTKKLRDFILSEESLLPELLADASPDAIRDFSKRLLSSTAFEELDRRSLMARVVKEFPFVQELLVTKTVKEQPLIVSRASLERRRAELDDIVQKRIPQNSKEIGVARSYGDLRENFEFKAAKDLQRVLLRRRAELEVLIARAQPTDFTDAQTDSVQIGTAVTVTDLATNQSLTYHILGAWDSDPARGIISYPAALAQTLLNKRPGDTADAGGQKLRVESISKVPAEILAAL
jgi:transcription elongation GreA/GreB family factor